MAYTMFEVSDGNSVSQRFRNYYLYNTLLKTLLMTYNTPLLLNSFH